VLSHHHLAEIHNSFLFLDLRLGGIEETISQRTDSWLKEFQRENQGFREEVANFQGQFHWQKLRDNQELAIALRGINKNTRQIGEMAQQLVNPLNHPQHPVNSNESVGSGLPSTFHSVVRNEDHLAPHEPPLVPV
jgi:hypothetical protein